MSLAADRDPTRAWRRAGLTMCLATALLVAAGLRHILVWGEGGPFAFSIRPLLDVFETACLLGFVVLAGRACLLAVRLSRAASTDPSRPLLRWSLPALVLAVAAPPFASNDIVDYVLRGRILGVHGANPYTTVGRDFPGDPFVAFGDAAWKEFPLPYGPVVAEVQGAVAWCVDWLPLSPLVQLIAAVVLFKVLFALCHVGCAFAAARIAARLRPGSERAVLPAVLWNPLLLFEGVAAGHNDPLVAVLVLLAIDALLAVRDGRAAVVLGLASLTKFVPGLLAPLLCVWSWRRGRPRHLAAGVLVVGAIAALWSWRFFAAPGALDFAGRQSEVTRSSLAWALEQVFGLPVATWLRVARPAVVVVALAAAVRLWRRPQVERFVGGCAATMLAMVALGTAGFGAWYHLWWLPLGLVLGRGPLHRLAWILGLSAPVGYVYWTMTRDLGAAHQWLQFGVCLLLPVLLAWFGPRRLREGIAALQGVPAASGDVAPREQPPL